VLQHPRAEPRDKKRLGSPSLTFNFQKEVFKPKGAPLPARSLPVLAGP